MIATQSVELRAGAKLLVKDVALRINSGDRIGFVGRNGAGKSTLAKCLAGETLPAGGQITRTGTIGYLPQDPRTGDQEETVINRILSARGLDQIMIRMRKAEEAMATATPEELELALDRYSRVDSEFNAAGGYGASAEAESIATNLGLPERLFEEPIQVLSGGQRRRVELARLLFSGAETLLLDEPTNHLDAESINWLRDYLAKYSGGLVVISHDVALIETVVNRVFYIDANRNVIDVYNMGSISSSVKLMSIAERKSARSRRRRPKFCRSKARRCARKHPRQQLRKECYVVLKHLYQILKRYVE